jgi:hypothetical protein
VVAGRRAADRPPDQATTAERQWRKHVLTAVAADLGLGGRPVVRPLLRETPDPRRHPIPPESHPTPGLGGTRYGLARRCPPASLPSPLPFSPGPPTVSLMRTAAVVIVLIVLMTALVSGCNRDSSPRSASSAEADRRPLASVSCIFHIVSNGAPATIEWPADARECISESITQDFKGTRQVIHCGSVHDNPPSCGVTWREPSGAECRGHFTLSLSGPITVLDGSTVICSQVTGFD